MLKLLRNSILIFLLCIFALEVSGLMYAKSQMTREGILSQQTIKNVSKSVVDEPQKSVVSINSSCTGYIAKRNYVVTAAHCIYGDLPQRIAFWDGKVAPGFVEKMGDGQDWAIIRTYTKGYPVAHVSAKPLGVGEMVYHVRYLEHEEHQYKSWGVYAGLYCDFAGLKECYHWMALAAIGGDSGGPVFNREGYVIGIMSRGYIMAPMAMAVPADYAQSEL